MDQPPQPHPSALAPRLVRSSSSIRGALLAALFAVAFVVLGVVTSGNGNFVWWIFVPFFLLMAWRVPSIGYRIGSTGVTMVSLFGSRDFNWKEIDHFAILPMGNYQNVGQVVLKDGRQYGTYGVSGARWEQSRQDVQRRVDELNNALTAWRSLQIGGVVSPEERS